MLNGVVKIVLLCGLAALLSVPPIYYWANIVAVELWPPSGAMHLHALLSGAHHSLLVTKACEIGLFDALFVPSAERAAAPHRWLAFVLSAPAAVLDAVAVTTTHPAAMAASTDFHRATAALDAECVPFSAIAARVRGFNAPEDFVDPAALIAVADALVALGVIRDCSAPPYGAPPAENVARAYGLRSHARRHLVSPDRHPSEFSQRGSGDMFLCGMGRIANDPAVLNGLLQLDRVILSRNVKASDDSAQVEVSGGSVTDGDARGFRLQRGAAIDDLWRGFSNHSGDFIRQVARRVALAIHAAATETQVGPWRVVDVGGGSGTFLYELADTLAIELGIDFGERDYFALFELPAVVAANEARRAAFAARGKTTPGSQPTFVTVAGSVFDERSFAALRSVLPSLPSGAMRTARRVVLMNSFLQHFAEDVCVDLISRFVSALRGEQAAAGGGSEILVAITELETPSGVPNALLDVVPMARVFNAVLVGFTEHGRVRRAGEYTAIGLAAGAVRVERTVLFPMPAALTLLWFAP